MFPARAPDGRSDRHVSRRLAVGPGGAGLVGGPTRGWFLDDLAPVQFLDDLAPVQFIDSPVPGQFIDDPTDVGLALAMLVVVVAIYVVLDRIRPGYGEFPAEFSAALRWLDANADGARVLAWWDYAAPLREYTDARPVLDGPSRAIEDLIDDPSRVRTWVDDGTAGRVGAFFLAESTENALSCVGPDEFDLLLVARSDLLKAPAMREAARASGTVEIADPEAVVLRQLLERAVEWRLVFENEQVRIYRSPAPER